MISRLQAAHVVGAEPLAQLRIGDALLEVVEARLLDHLHDRRLGVDDRVGEPLGEDLGDLVVELLERVGIGSEVLLLLVGVGRVLRRQDPLRRALEQREVRRLIDDRRR